MASTILTIIKNYHPRAISFPQLVKESNLDPAVVDQYLQDFESRGILSLDSQPEDPADMMMISFNAHARILITLQVFSLHVKSTLQEYTLTDISLDELSLADLDEEEVSGQFLEQLDSALQSFQKNYETAKQHGGES